MFIQQTQKIISAFTERYIKYDSERSDYYKINAYEDAFKQVVEFFINDYSLIVWLDEYEGLHIVNSKTHQSVFDYAEENGWSWEDVQYMKFGSKPSDKEVSL